ncbi:FXSXX-COOH protein [Micromonospora costi]|uniref:FXSXX-COOH protein n=1 Tax=Micromonospora costi TaxID=1530042 RepID=UPI001F4EB21E|nr:FXSXX-COOH protein [Micromonospora costi]
MDRIPDRPTTATAPLDDLRHTPLGRIPIARARTVALSDTRTTDRPSRLDVAAFGSSI